MALPPIHRIDATPILVLGDDDAWDHERIDRELAEDGAHGDHPVVRYFAGVSRYDLETVRDYLDRSKSPVQFTLRRLGVDEYARARDDANNLGEEQAAAYAAPRGLRRIDGIPELSTIAAAGKLPLRQSDVEAVVAVIGKDRWIEIGKATLRASREVDAVEGKR